MRSIIWYTEDKSGAEEQHQRRFCVTCLQTSWTPADTECRPHGTTADTWNTAASSGTTCTHNKWIWTETPALCPSVCLWMAALTLQGLHSNSSTAADWSDVGSPSSESPGRTVRPASWLTELWLLDLSSEPRLSVGRMDKWEDNVISGSGTQLAQLLVSSVEQFDTFHLKVMRTDFLSNLCP